MDVDNANSCDVDVEGVKLRSMQCELNMLSRPDGSAIFSQGNTVVMSAIYGPVEGKSQHFETYNANIEVNFSPKSGLSTVKDRLRETIIRQTCESAILVGMHPRTTISINIQEMQDYGGLLACSLNACCLALINSGLPMQFLFAAVNCAIKKDGEIIFDPTNKELEDVTAELTFAFDSVDKKVLSCSTSGNFSVSQYKECLLKCEKSCEKIFNYYRDVVKKYAKTI